ncbi:MAG TPA: hypothetical protein H9818_03325 [Candidatus Phocaeicola gallistercoris]|nr:hypothetical protein [Candidatus Phocaeicola gallistercoris]
MASRRILKKNVNHITDLLCGLYILESSKTENKDKQIKLNTILEETLNLHQDLISRISHTETGNVKNFYKKFSDDFKSGTENILNKLGDLSNER